ncbi:MAG: hypothetical protein ABJN04_13420 [Hyphomicrobiales bacterium]
MYYSKEELISLICDRNSGHNMNFSPVKKIHATLLKEIILHQDDALPISQNEIEISNHTIVGDLIFRGCEIGLAIHLKHCHVMGSIDLSGATTKDISLTGTKVEKLLFSEIKCNGSIILNYGFTTHETVWGNAARINGQLGCTGGRFAGHPIAISIERARIEEAFFWREIKSLWGAVELAHADIRIIIDDPDSWPREYSLGLDGLKYEQLGGNTSTEYFDRLEWLKRQYKPHLTYDFRPQPWTQLSKVLSQSGRELEAKKILVAQQTFQRDAYLSRRNRELNQLRLDLARTSHFLSRMIVWGKIERNRKLSSDTLFNDLWAYIRWFWVFLFGVLAGYGYYPSRVIFWSISMVTVGTLLFSAQQDNGNIVPNSARLLAVEWKDAAASHKTSQYDAFFQLVPDHPKFHPFGYALDTFIPLIDLGQEKYWTVVKKGKDGKSKPQPLVWLYIALGWVFSAIFAASITGLVKK